MYVLNSGANSTCPNSGSVSVMATATGSVTNTGCVGLNPINMVQAANAGQVFVLNQADNIIRVPSRWSDPTSLGLVATLTSANGLGLHPVYATSTADGTYVFVVTQGDGVNPGTLDILTTGDSPAVAASVPLGVNPTYSYLDPHFNRLYVTNTGDNTVSVFDASNVNPSNTPPIPSLTPPVAVGTAPAGVAALQDGSRFYVANSGSNNVTVVSATSLPSCGPFRWDEPYIRRGSIRHRRRFTVTNQGSFSTSIIQTVNETVSLAIAAPAQNPNCISSCTLQQPMMILTQ